MKLKLFLLIVVAAIFVGYSVGLKISPPKPRQPLGFHQSYFSQPEFFDQAFAAVSKKQIQPDPSVAAIVVNHHLLAAPFIAETVNKIATDEPVTVVLISPNHFSAGNSNIITSMYDWQTPYGVLPANGEAIKKLRGASVEEFPFVKEHGISGIVPFIRKALPNASVVPVIFKDKTPSEQVDALVDSFKSIKGKTILIASVDFSHYLPSDVADFHDVLSEHVLHTFDYDKISRLEIDSRPAIRALLRYAQSRGAEQFTVLNHSNSAKLTSKPDLLSGTSYVTGYYAPGPRAPDSHRTLLVAGDIAAAPKNVFSQMEQMFVGSDQTLVTELAPGAAAELQKLGVSQNSGPFTTMTIDASTQTLAQAVAEVKPHSVITINWNGQKDQTGWTHSLIDAGADLVVGRGSQPGKIETYKNRLIVYSLGILVPADPLAPAQSLAVGSDTNQDNITYYLFALQYSGGQASFLKPGQGGILGAQTIYHFSY